MPSQRQKVEQEAEQVPVVLVGQSFKTQEIRAFAETAARNNCTILLWGETGSGKEEVARLIHFFGSRGKPFVTVDCGGLMSSVLETELFGHVPGAFTDAVGEKRGLVETASNGILFIDELENASHPLQAKLLRTIDKKRVRRVGSTSEMRVNFRTIAATNVNPEEAVSRGQLRADLYYRLNVIGFKVPPLRERKSDIPLMVKHFLKLEQDSRLFSNEAIAAMQQYDWPGNVRELKNFVEKMAFHAGRAETIEAKHVTPHLPLTSKTAVVEEKAVRTFGESMRRHERELLEQILTATKGNYRQAALQVGLSRSTLVEKVKRNGLSNWVQTIRKS